MPKANTPCQLYFEVLVKQVPIFLHAPTQASKIWKRGLVDAIPKPNKPLGDPKSYRPISLACVSFKILDSLYVHVKPNIDPLLPREQAGFQGRSSS